MTTAKETETELYSVACHMESANAELSLDRTDTLCRECMEPFYIESRTTGSSYLGDSRHRTGLE